MLWSSLMKKLFLYFLISILFIGSGKSVSETNREKSKIKLSNGLQVTVKKSGDMVYLTSGSFRCKNRSYNRIDGILRDVEGYLIWKKLTNDCV